MAEKDRIENLPLRPIISIIRTASYHLAKHLAKLRLCIKPRIQELRTECWDWGECRQTFRGMSPNISGNVPGMSPKIRGMSPNVPGNVLKQSRELSEIIWGML